MNDTKTISVVIPAFNEEECIAALIDRLKEIMDKLKYPYEVIIVDDGSKDRTFEVIRELSVKYKFLKGVKLSRNMGHQAALDCGLKHASGDAVISMDADLQHPPELIPQMVKLWEEGYEIVYTQKLENQQATLLYKVWAKTFYSLFNKYSQIKLTPSGSDFRLMGRKSLEAVLSMPEYHKFFRGLVPFVGFKSTSISFDVQKRFAGKRKYNFKQSMKLASDGLFSFSDFALKIPFIIGGIALIIILLYLLYTLILLIFHGTVIMQGWTSVIAILVLSISIQLIFMGVLGVYIGKIFFEVKRRPVFFADETVGELKVIK
ncbi:MAG: glycosyltransferase family 2 protein [Bacteroidales bacterium]|nr:glycosyltransferase family 2 protein [Bacteroidales bacterium]